MDKEQWLKIGAFHYRDKRYKQAYNAYTQAILLDPHYVRAYIEKGLVLFCMQRYEEALSIYEQAIQLDPIYKSSYIAKSDELLIEGKSLYTSKRYKESLIVFEQAIQFHHMNKRAYILKKWVQDRIAHSKANKGGLSNEPFRCE